MNGEERGAGCGLEALAHKIALRPNAKQREQLAQAAGVARFAYNWGLDQWDAQYHAGKLDPSLSAPSWISLNGQLNAVKRERFPWMLNVTKCAPERAMMEVGRAYANFFKHRAKHPKPHKKGQHDSFYLHRNAFKLKGQRIRIPKLGWVRMTVPLRFQGRIVSATVSKRADQWFVSILVEMRVPSVTSRPLAAVGVDLGCKDLATLSTGEKIPGPKPHNALLARQRRLARSLSRKQKGSHNRAKVKLKLARHHLRVRNIRQDALHKLTTDLTRRFTLIGIEDLNVKGMSKNHALARSVTDQSFGEFRRQLEYKAKRTGTTVVVADRWFPSSKLCSTCGHRLDDLPLSTRDWSCPACATEHDRDVNAAVNLRNMAVWPTVSACGEGSSGHASLGAVKLPSMKQEVRGEPLRSAQDGLHEFVQVIS